MTNSNMDKKTAGLGDMKVKLSTLWVFVMFNYLYCDVLGIMAPRFFKELMTGHIAGFQITQGFLLGVAILMEIPIAMVLLSRVLKYRANRWVNIIAGTIMTAIQFLTMFQGAQIITYYNFFSIIEIACTSLIVWYAWKWPNPEGSPNK